MPEHSSTAVILIAHGSRRPEANDDVRLIADQLRECGEYICVVTAYLELAAPTIAEAAAECIAEGAHDVLLMPYFLSAGKHVVNDLQTHCHALSEAHPAVTFALCPPLGVHPLMLSIVQHRLGERLPQAT